MDTLANLDKAKPYNLPLKVKIIAVGEILHYQKHEEDRQRLTVAIADDTGCAKCVSYSPGSFKKLELNKAVVIKNYIVQDKTTIVITKTTKVYAAGVISETFSQYTELAETFVHPADAPLVHSLETAKKSPIKSTISVRGTLVEVSGFCFQMEN